MLSPILLLVLVLSSQGQCSCDLSLRVMFLSFPAHSCLSLSSCARPRVDVLMSMFLWPGSDCNAIGASVQAFLKAWVDPGGFVMDRNYT